MSCTRSADAVGTGSSRTAANTSPKTWLCRSISSVTACSGNCWAARRATACAWPKSSRGQTIEPPHKPFELLLGERDLGRRVLANESCTLTSTAKQTTIRVMARPPCTLSAGHNQNVSVLAHFRARTNANFCTAPPPSGT